MGGSEAVWLLMEEYRTLRGEILASIAAQQAALTFGGAVIAILVAAGTSLREDNLGSSVAIFLLLIPLTSLIALNIWLGEILRMLRAGSWVRHIERRVNRHASLDGHDCPLLFWENWAHGSNMDNVEKLHLKSIAGGYLLLALASIGLGTFDLFSLHGNGDSWRAGTNIVLGSLVAVVLGVLVAFAARTWAVYRRADEFRTGEPHEGRPPCGTEPLQPSQDTSVVEASRPVQAIDRQQGHGEAV